MLSNRRAAAAAILLVAFACSGDGASAPPIVAKITAADQLIEGREAAGRAGDYVLANGRVRFVVQDAGSASGWGIYGGSLVDLERSGEGDDRLQEIFYQCELRAFEPKSVEIVNDGRDGRPGVLRFTGRDRGIPLIDAAFATQPLGVEMSVEYVLPPDRDTLEIILRAKDVQRMGSRELACGVVVLRGDGYAAFTENTGFGDLPSELPYLAAAAPDGRSSWVLWAGTGPLSPQLQQNEVLPMTTGARNLPGGGTLEEHFFIAVGGGDVESALAERRRRLADSPAERLRHVNLDIISFELEPERSNVVWTFFDGTRAVTSARPGAGGLAHVALEPKKYRVTATFEDRELTSFDMTVPSGPGAGFEFMAGISLGRLAIDTVRVDRDGTVLGPTAAKLVLARGRDAPLDAARDLERYVAPGEVFALLPGEYTAFVSRGPEYELHRENITITNGEETKLHARVAHVVETDGWISADLHVHSTKSVDADAPRRARVLGAIGEGVDVLISTDHDIVTDYAPIARGLGVEDQLRTISGIEVSPAYGHINAMPLVPETPEAYWRVQWYRYVNDLFERVLEPAELVRDLRAISGVEYIQINHPRSGQGIFNYIRFDASTGESEKEFPAADGFELLNSRGGGPFDEALADFTALVKVNRRMTATGVSDAHRAYDGVGYARTMIRAEEGDPTRLDASAMFRALREGRAIALSGPMVTLEAKRGAARAEIGETLQSAPGELIELAVHVEAPSWMDVSSYRVLENGEVLFSGALGEADRDPANPVVRLDRSFSTAPSRDSFYLVIVEGAPGTSNEPVMHARARSVTNPVFVDTDGGGFRF